MAADVGGRTTPGSGATWSAKGDVTDADWMIECKTTDHKSYPLTNAVMTKVRLEATLEGKRAVLQVEIQGKRYAVLPWDEYLTMRET